MILLRRVRAALKMGLVWAGIWFTAGILLFLVVGPDAADVPFPLGFALLGFLAGNFFSWLLAMMEGKRRFDQMSLPRFGGWGAAGGGILGIVFGLLTGLGADVIVPVLILALAGGASASGTLVLARQAERQRLAAALSSDETKLLDRGGL